MPSCCASCIFNCGLLPIRSPLAILVAPLALLLPHGDFVVVGLLALRSSAACFDRECSHMETLSLPHGDLLPSGYRSYFMDLLLRISIPIYSKRIDPPVVEDTSIDPPLEESSRNSCRNSSSSHTAHSNSNTFETRGANAPPLSNNGANAPPPLWRLFDFAIHTGPAIDVRQTPVNLL